MQSVRNYPTFRRCIWPPHSG